MDDISRYPRPQMVRKEYMLLDGEWKLDGRKIIVPFCPQSSASKYDGPVGDKLVYERNFEIPKEWGNQRILLHFGAVDEVCKVYVNGTFAGSHEGGYLPFYFDITEMIRRGDGNLIRVEATDTLSHLYPYGKQRKDRGGMWYTPVSGLYKSVWMEPVPDEYIESLRIDTTLDEAKIIIKTSQRNGIVDAVAGTVTLLDEGGNETLNDQSYEISEGEAVIHIDEPRNWSDTDPYLYRFRVECGRDSVESYFALRTIEILPDKEGIPRLCLNKRPVFLHGLLDQGYFQEGIYTPKDPGEFAAEIKRIKALGFNCLRKHIKVEPETFYYECDRLGMLVVQDMVNNGPYHYLRDTVMPTIGFKKKKERPAFTEKEKRRRKIFEEHMTGTIEHLYDHPSIVMYTIFNEGWGQFESDRLYEAARKLDPTRVYDSTSGWYAHEKSDVESEHIYFRNERLATHGRPVFLSECGGYSYPVEGHLFNTKKSYGYGDKLHSRRDLTEKIKLMYDEMVIPSIKDGLCGCIYTQVSDVEDEINGLFTYDRKVCKVVEAEMKSIASDIGSEIDKIRMY